MSLTDTTPSALDKTPADKLPPSGARALIAEGRHNVRIIQYGPTKNPDSGSVSYAIECRFHDGRHLTFFGGLSTAEKNGISAWEITRRTLIAGGWDGRDIRNVQLTEQFMYATVAHEEYRGKINAKIVSLDVSIVKRNALKGDELDHLASVLAEADDARSR